MSIVQVPPTPSDSATAPRTKRSKIDPAEQVRAAGLQNEIERHQAALAMLFEARRQHLLALRATGLQIALIGRLYKLGRERARQVLLSCTRGDSTVGAAS